MAGTIKGISVSIGGDTIDLKNSIKDVEKITKSLQSELTLVNKQLKFDPSNSVLLAQKQEILEERISATKETLTKLQSVQDQVEAQAKSGELGADKYRAYQREIEATKSILNNLEKQLDETKHKQSEFENSINSTNLAPSTTEVKKLKDEVGELETEAKKTDLSNLKKEVDDVKSSAKELKDTLKETVGGIGAGVTAAGGTAAAAMMSFDSVDSALNHIQASTNLSKDQMDGFRGALEEIYNGNYGEDMNDIASKMANIVQYTNETDPDKIKKYAVNLYALEDSLGLDFNETLRGTQGLIKNMGLTADEAFDYITSGAQNGLNYSGELSDNLSEYTSLFGQAGFTAKQMFSILDNGTESGAYNLDKVNDFVKEFTISLADGRIEENIGSFSDKTGDLFKNWKDGKATAADVFYSVINDLSNAENKQEALTTASNVWSSLGEDNALNIITSLDDVNTKFDNVKGTMNEVNDIEYDDLGNKLEGLGRKVQTEIINPAVEDFYPEAEDFIEWISDNLDTLIPILEGVAKQAAIIWGGKKITECAKGVGNLIGTFKNLTTAAGGTKNALKGLDFAQKANIAGALATAILVAVEAVKTYNQTQWENSSLKKELDKTAELTDEWGSLADEISSKIDEINDKESDLKADFEYVDNMKKRLQEIIDDGTIDESEESEYKTIIDLLSEKVDGFEGYWSGLSLKEVNGKITITDNIGNVNTEIDKLLENWKIAQAKLTLGENYSGLQTEYSKKKSEVSVLEKEDNYGKAKEELADYIFDKSSLNRKESKLLADELEKSNGDFKKASDSIRRMIDNNQLNSKDHKNLIWNVNDTPFWQNFEKSIFGLNFDAPENIKKSIEDIQKYKDETSHAKNELNSLDEARKESYGVLNALNGNTNDYISLLKLSEEYQLDDATVLSLCSDSKVKSIEDLQTKAAEQYAQMNADVESSGQSQAQSTAASVARIDGIWKDNFNPDITAKTKMVKVTEDVYASSPQIQTATGETARKAQRAANIGGWFGLGGSFIGQLINGIFGRNDDAETAGKTVATNTKNSSGKVSLFSVGNNLVSGFINGILSGEAFKRIGSAAESVAKNAYNSIKSWLGIQSPSKETKKLGKYFSEGFAIGIIENAKVADSAAKSLARSAQRNLNIVNPSNTLSKIGNLKNAARISNNSTNNTRNVTVAPNINVNVLANGVSNEVDMNVLANKISEKIGDLIISDGMKWG